MNPNDRPMTEAELDELLAGVAKQDSVEMDPMTVTASAPEQQLEVPPLEQQKTQDEDEIARALRMAQEGEQNAIDRNTEISARPESNADISGRVNDEIFNLGSQTLANINKTKPLTATTVGRDLGAEVKNSEAAATKSVRDRIMAQAKADTTPLAQLDVKQKLMGGARKERLAGDSELLTNEANKGDLSLKIDKDKSEQGQFAHGTVESELQRARLKTQLEKSGIQVDSDKLELLDAASARRILEDEKKLGKKVEVKQITIGDRTGYAVFDENGTELRRDLGVKPQTGLSDKEDLRTRQLSQDLEKENIPELETQLSEIDRFLNKYGGDINKVPGSGRLERLLPTSVLSLTGDKGKEGAAFRQSLQAAANSLLKSRSGSAVTAPEQKRVLEELGQGSFSDPEMVLRGIKAMNNIKDKIKQNIRGGYSEKIKGKYEQQGGIALDSSKAKNTQTPAQTAPSNPARTVLNSAADLP